MKWVVSLFTLFCIVRCSCSTTDLNTIEEGTYTFTHLEYYEDDKTITNDCSDLNTVPIGKKTICESRGMVMTFDDNKYTLSMTEGHLVNGYYKLVGDQIHVSSQEDGEYKYTGWMHYRDKKVFYGINEIYIVLDN